MKKVKVKYINQNSVDEGILFESLDDVKYLDKPLKRAEKGVLTKFVKSGESMDRLDHVIPGFKPLEKAIACLAVTNSNFFGLDAVYLLPNSSKTYIDSLTSMLVRGYQVFQNRSGGLCPVEGTLEILEVIEDYLTEIKEDASYKIAENSKVINLENDWELENKSVDYMNERFTPWSYSYIKDLKTVTESQYKRIFKKFKEQGGEYVYVYTTGIDVEQMYEYSIHALDAGLSKFIFDFNKGLDKEINKFIDWLSQRAEVEVLNK